LTKFQRFIFVLSSIAMGIIPLSLSPVVIIWIMGKLVERTFTLELSQKIDSKFTTIRNMKYTTNKMNICSNLKISNCYIWIFIFFSSLPSKNVLWGIPEFFWWGTRIWSVSSLRKEQKSCLPNPVCFVWELNIGSLK
jgi:hypothetical protein